MSNFFMFFVLALCGFIPALWVRKIFSQRIQALEQDLKNICVAVSEMAEIQVKSHRKCSASTENLEMRIMELSIPTNDSTLPLERRHQVLTLARQGMALDDIVKRLKAPVGEAELILNLGKYVKPEGPIKDGTEGQVRQYA